MAEQYDFTIDLTADTSHTRIIRLVGYGKNVVDFGCATGYLSRVLSNRFSCNVTGIEKNPQAAEKAREVCRRVIVGDAERLDYATEIGAEKFDVLIFADVLEHLKDPRYLLTQIREFLTPAGYVLASIPNIAHSALALDLLKGNFDYRAFGLLDDTHIRFFTKKTIYDLFESAGYLITRLERLRAEPGATEFKIDRSEFPPQVLQFAMQHDESTTYQFIVKAHPATETGRVAHLKANLEELQGRNTELEGLARLATAKDTELDQARQAIFAKDAELDQARHHHDRLRADLDAARQAILAKDAELDQARHHHDRLRADLDAAHQTILAKDAELDQLRKENRRLWAEADHRSKDLAAVLNSRSWRFTQPLRKAWDFLGRLASQDRDALSPGLRGNLELPLRSTCIGNGLLRVSGWSFSEGSPIVALAASCNGATYPLNHGVSRKDVQAAFPQAPQAEASGFEGSVSMRLRRGERIIVAVHAELEDGRKVQLFERWVRVSSQASDPIAGTAAARLYRGAKFLVLLSRRMALCAWEGYWPLSWEDFLSRYRKFTSEFMAQERLLPMVLDAPRQYEVWLAKRWLTPERLAALREESRRLAYRPTISVVLPVYDVAEAWLREAIESVREQAYENWELCLVNDASPAPHVRPVLDEYAARDARVRVVHLGENAGIAGASNHGLRLATGEFVGFLDHDDVLYPDALAEVVRRLDRDPALDVLYSDEDQIEPDGRRSSPFFKPDWSPDLLLALNYTCHFSVYRRSLLEELGGLRARFDGSQDYDLMLRATERTRRIAHIPKILYGWRRVPGSAAATVAAKPYAYRTGQAAIAEALARRGADARVEMFAPGRYDVRYALRGNPKVSIVVPMRDRADLTRLCVASIESKSTYKNIELLVIDNGSVEEASRRLLDELALRHRVVRYDRPFNYSAINNFGAAQATGDYLVFLNNDTEVETPDWLEAMLEHAQRREVAAVGAKLLYPNRRIQHAGVFLLGTELAVAGHAFKHLPEDTDAWFALARVARNVSAVTAACMMVRRQIFEALGGFDERIRVAFNDVDLCLRMRQAGYLVVYTPLATLIHHESATRKALHPPEDERLARERWRELLAAGDPYYNPNLSRTREDFALDI